MYTEKKFQYSSIKVLYVTQGIFSIQRCKGNLSRLLSKFFFSVYILLLSKSCWLEFLINFPHNDRKSRTFYDLSSSELKQDSVVRDQNIGNKQRFLRISVYINYHTQLIVNETGDLEL